MAPDRTKSTAPFSVLFSLALFYPTLAVRADGVMVQGDRELFREGPARRGYCTGQGSASELECDRVKTKVLSSYGYFRGHLLGGPTLRPGDARAGVNGLAAVRVSVASGALPGGDLAVGSIDGVLGDSATSRLRLTVLEAESLFLCRDGQSGALVSPLVGMFTSECRPTSVAAVDAGLIALQWDVKSDRFVAEWLRLGPSFELLANGFGQAHLLRSIVIGLPFDLRSVRYGDLGRGGNTTFGAGLRLSAFYRSPHWETRLDVRHRAALGGTAVLHTQTVQAELRVLRNFFLTDGLIVQAGLSLRGTWSQRPADSFVLWAATDQRWLGFAGLYLGWISEAPDI